MHASGAVQTIKVVLEQYSKFEIATYQRNYAWDREQLREFFEDLKSTVVSDEDHFLGTLILEKTGANTATVVDGQQRLTTLFILLARIRDELHQHGADPIQAQLPGALNTYLLNDVQKLIFAGGLTTTPRMDANYLLKDLFFQRILSEPSGRQTVPRRGPRYTKALRDNFHLAASLVSAYLAPIEEPQAKRVALLRLFEALTARFKVLTITTGSTAESLDVFMTLNDRGLPLGPADIVRGRILQHVTVGLDDDQVRAVHQKVLGDWENVLTQLNTGAPDSYLRHYLLSTSIDKVQKKKIPGAVEKRIKDDDPAVRASNANALWNNICSEAEQYALLLAPDMGGSLEYHLKVLATLADSYRVFALAVLAPECGVEQSAREELIRLTYVLSIRWFMAGRNAQDLESEFQRLAVELRAGADPTDVADELRDRCSFTFDAGAYMRERASGLAIVRALLHGINRAFLAGSNDIPFGSAELHVEHIAPETPTPHWQSVLDLQGDDLHYDDVVEYLGNKTLLDHLINKSLKQQTFAQKKLRYEDSSAKLTVNLGSMEGEWDHGAIVARTEWLAETFDLLFVPDPQPKNCKRFTVWLAEQAYED